MKPDTILKADLLDIIFENKNKDYGAYPLRKYYHERLYRSLGIIFLAALILALIGFFYKHKTTTDIFTGPDILISKLADNVSEIPLVPENPQPPQKHAALPVSAPSTNDHVPIIDDHSSTKEDISKEVAMSNDPGTEGKNIPSSDGPTGNGEVKSTLPATGTEPAKPIDRNTASYTAEVMPAFPGGIEALRKFLKKNLVTPGEIDPGEMVSVTIQFIVGYDGNLKGFRIIEDGGDAYNNEVIRVLKKMPAWIPGKTRGENVSVYYSIPVKFTPAD